MTNEVNNIYHDLFSQSPTEEPWILWLLFLRRITCTVRIRVFNSYVAAHIELMRTTVIHVCWWYWRYEWSEWMNEWMVCSRLYYDVSKRKLALMRDGFISAVSGLMLLSIICVHRYRTSETFHGVNIVWSKDSTSQI